MSSESRLTGKWFVELAALREQARHACDEMRATIAEFQNLQIVGPAIREEVRHACRQLRLAVSHSQNARNARHLDRVIL